MAPCVHRLVKSAWLPLLSVLLLSEALSVRWTPGDYADTASDALRFLSDYNSTAEEVYFNLVSASWSYNSNLTEFNSRLQVELGVFFSFLDKSHQTTLTHFSTPLLFLRKENVTICTYPEAIRNYSLLGRAGTMFQVCLLRVTTPGLWSSATKPLKGMVRTMGLK
uniref:Uncharacterized protein n=1 Tax=Xiphophorus maculatus TaxID=8083 RepID=A0A3B5Q3G1_XIPMA